MEVADGGKEHPQPQLMLRLIARFLARLDLQGGVVRGIKPIERGGVGVELIAKHQNEIAHDLEIALRLPRGGGSG